MVRIQVTLIMASFLLLYDFFVSICLVNLILLTAAELIALDIQVLPSRRVKHCRETASSTHCQKPFQYRFTEQTRGRFPILIVNSQFTSLRSS